MRVKRSGLCFVVVVLAWMLVSMLPQISRAASSTYNSGGFELSRFSSAFTNPSDATVIGNVRGQDSGVSMWKESTTDPNGAEGAVTGTAVIESKSGGSGSDLQDLKVTRTEYDDRWAPTIAYTSSGGDTVRDVHWSMKVTHTTTDSTKYGPFFGVETYDSSGGPALRIGGLGVDATTGEVLFEDPSISGFNITTGDAVVAFDTYNDFDLVMDFSTHKESLKLNGTTLMSNINFFNNTNSLTDADVSALQADAVAFNPAGTAYFDNVAVVAPEPASCGLLLFLSAFGIGKRRR
jgi:hypothetical protein